MKERGESQADLARRLGVSRARITQVLQILELDPIALEFLEQLSGPMVVSEKALRELRRCSPAAQREYVASPARHIRTQQPCQPRAFLTGQTQPLVPAAPRS